MTMNAISSVYLAAAALGREASTAGSPAPLPIVGNWEWDFASGAITWSDGHYRLLGLTPGASDASYDLALERVHPDDRAAVERATEAAKTAGSTLDIEFRIVRPDGMVRWVASKGEIFKDSNGQPSWAAGALFDITEIRQSQFDLAAREQRYRALATMNSLGEWHACADGDLTEAPFWEAFTGQSPEESRGWGWLDCVHPEDVAGVQANWREAIRIGACTEFSYRARHKSGEYRWFLSRAVPIRNADGSVREWVGSDTDIQVRREAEEALRVSESRLRMALEAGCMVTWDYELATGHISRSSNSEQVLGFGSGPIEDMRRRIHPEDIGKVSEAMRRAREEGERYDVEFRVLGPEGSAKWLHSRGQLLRDVRTRPDRLIGITWDVTASKRAENDERHTAQKRSRLSRRLETLAKLAGHIVWLASADGAVTDLRGWQEFNGQPLQEAQGWGWLNVLHPADRERVREAVQGQIDTRTAGTIDFRMRSRTGDYQWIRSRSAPVFGADGQAFEWIGICEPFSRPASEASGAAPAASGALPLITGAQVRAARGILRWSVRDLAESSGVSASSIRRIEEDEGVPETRDVRILWTLRSTLEKAGVEILTGPDSQGAVRPSNARG